MVKEIDIKVLYNPKTFEKALKIIFSKSKKPKEEFWSYKIRRYDEYFENWDVVGCAKILNELKTQFDGSKVENSLTLEMIFVKALWIISELYTYQNGNNKDKRWDNTVKLLKKMNISEDHTRFTELKGLFKKSN